MRDNQAVRERLEASVGLEQLWKEGEDISRLTPSGMGIQLVKMAAGSIKASPFTAMMTLITMVFSMLVFAAFLLLVENLNRALQGSSSEISMSIFLRDSVTEDQRKELEATFAGSSIVRNQNFQTKEQALSTFRADVGGDSPLLEGIEGTNPLPSSYELTFRSVDDLEAQIESLADNIRQQPFIEHVEYSRGVISAIVTLIDNVRFLGSCTIVVMLFLSGFIITVAIRLALYSHRDEIEIMYLVGATRTFIRSPYMVEGLAQGIVGALGSLVLLYLVYIPLRGSVASAQMAQLIFGELEFLSFSSMCMVLALGIFVGVLGSYAAVRRIATVTIGE